MKKLIVCCVVLLSLAAFARAEEGTKLKVLWTTGGCCHDYQKHAPLLTAEIGKYAAAEFDIVFGLDIFKNKDYAKGYDVVVYDLCYGGETDKDLIGNITATIAAGKPTVFVHCSLHNFRAAETADDWREAMGMTSTSHDGFRALTTKKVAKHPTTDFWPDDWKTPGEELYRTVKFWPNATALMTVHSPESKKDHVVTWINRYGKARVFATTLGHNMLTVGQKDYHRLLANGVLWVCEKLDASGKPAAGYAGSDSK